MKDKQNEMSCEHGKTHVEDVFVDLEDDGTLSYDKMEVCDNCGESWCVGDFSDNGEILAKQMFPNGLTIGKQKVKNVE